MNTEDEIRIPGKPFVTDLEVEIFHSTTHHECRKPCDKESRAIGTCLCDHLNHTKSKVALLYDPEPHGQHKYYGIAREHRVKMAHEKT